MYQITENDFFYMCDVVDMIPPMEDKYFPRIEELKKHNVEDNLDNFLPMLIYYSNDPLKNTDMDTVTKEEYRKSIKYIKKIIYGIDLI